MQAPEELWLQLVQRTLEADHTALTKPKHDLFLTPRLDFGRGQPNGEPIARELLVENRGTADVLLHSVFAVPDKEVFALTDPYGLHNQTRSEPVRIPAGEQLVVTAVWTPSEEVGVASQYAVVACELEECWDSATFSNVRSRHAAGC